MKPEEEIINLISADKIYIAISSMNGKLKRLRPKLSELVDLKEYHNNFVGERVYARIEKEDKKKARGMREGIEKFKEKFPKEGKILEEYIQEERTKKEKYLYFGVNPSHHLDKKDYLHIMKNLGFTEFSAIRLYPELLETSKTLSKKRYEERSILIGKEEDKEN